MAIEGESEGFAAQPDLQSGAVARHRGREVVEADGGVNGLVAPGEPPGRHEALGDRRPRQRHFDMGQRLVEAVPCVAQDQLAVRDPDFGERHLPCAVAGHRLEGAREARGQARPVRSSFRPEPHHDPRLDQGEVGRLDSAEQQRNEPQPRGQPAGYEGRLAIVLIAEREIAEADRAPRKDRYRGISPDRGLEAGDGLDLRFDCRADGLRGDQDRDGPDRGDRDSGQHGQGNSEALQAGSHSHRTMFRSLLRGPLDEGGRSRRNPWSGDVTFS